jgi:hypothetical protein
MAAPRPWLLSLISPETFVNRSVTAALGIVVVSLLYVACGGNGPAAPSAPQMPTPLPPVNPEIIWPGDIQVSSGQGDDGIGSSGPSGVAIVPDGNGGAMFAWEDAAYELVHEQRVDTNGDVLWQTNGVLLSNVSTYEASPQAVSDGAGGTIVAWVDGRAGFCDEGFQGECQIYAQRVDSNGNPLWNPSGVPIATGPSNHGSSGIAMTSDDNGGAFIAWEDARVCCVIYAQHVSSSGQPLWVVNGLQVSPTPTLEIETIGAPQIIADGDGGVIIAWWNVQYPPGQVWTVSAQRLNSSGAQMWNAQGVTVLGITGGSSNDNELSYALTSDGDGGAVFVGSFLSDTVTGIAMAQHIDGSGTVAWDSNGVQIASAPSQLLTPTIVGDGSGGGIIAWIDCVMQSPTCSILAQHADARGTLVWPADGVSITNTPNPKFGPIALSDGAGGAIVAWEDCPGISDPTQCGQEVDLYAQRINSNGQTLWQTNGFPVSSAPNNQGVQTGNENAGIYGATDNLGNTFFAWPDGRISDECFSIDEQQPSVCALFAQKLH